jgi:hypothetical protein
MQNYLHNLVVRMTNPLRIRIGGNSMDGYVYGLPGYLNLNLIRRRSTYVPEQSTPIKLTDPDAYYNDVPVDFGPLLFDIMNGMSDKVGAMQCMIGLSMRFPDKWDQLVQLAEDTENKLGERLDAMLLGNVSPGH